MLIEFPVTINEIWDICISSLKEHKKKAPGPIENRGKPLTVYKISHRQVFHPNFEPQTCHGSIRLFRKLDFGGNFGFWVFWPLPFSCFFFFFFSLVHRGARADTKIWLVTKKMIASCIPWVLTMLLFLSFCF